MIRAGAFSKATVILSHAGSAQAALNQTVEVETGDSANLTVVSLQDGTTLSCTPRTSAWPWAATLNSPTSSSPSAVTLCVCARTPTSAVLALS